MVSLKADIGRRSSKNTKILIMVAHLISAIFSTLFRIALMFSSILARLMLSVFTLVSIAVVLTCNREISLALTWMFDDIADIDQTIAPAWIARPATTVKGIVRSAFILVHFRFYNFSFFWSFNLS